MVSVWWFDKGVVVKRGLVMAGVVGWTCPDIEPLN